MIKIYLIGGLGNQLFQFALGKYLAEKMGKKLAICTSSYQYDRLRDFDLYQILADAERKKLVVCLDELSKFDKFCFKISKLTGKPFRGFLQEKKFDFNGLEQFSDSINQIRGYWQSEKYFGSSLDLLRKSINIIQYVQPNLQDVCEKISSSPSVSIHVRRGDYISSASATYGGICDSEYYRRAIDRILAVETDAQFYLFSDDINWCKENITWVENLVFCDFTTSQYQDLALMSLCKHNIIANSSFSWWGAYLNENDSKVVVGPTKWLNDDKVDGCDVMPAKWLRA